MVDTTTDNGIVKKNFLESLGIPCGCGSRKEIMTAGNWQVDASVVGAIILLAVGILLIQKDVFKVAS
jgi:hypothetical protein